MTLLCTLIYRRAMLMCCQSLEPDNKLSHNFGMMDTFKHTSGSAAGMGAWEFQVRLHGLRLTPLNRLCSQYICRAVCSQDCASSRTANAIAVCGCASRISHSPDCSALKQRPGQERLAHYFPGTGAAALLAEEHGKLANVTPWH